MDKSNILNLLSNYCPYDETEFIMKDEIMKFIQSYEHYSDSNFPLGHLTASAWILDKKFENALLAKHVLLKKWFQLGGHVESDDKLISDVAHREAIEESGLINLTIFDQNIFSIDVHKIPENACFSAHFHYDLRFLFIADIQDQLVMNEESIDLKWIRLDEIEMYNSSPAIQRMVEKTLLLRRNQTSQVYIND